MASTNQTENLGLPQFIDSDKPGWLTDFNTAMVKIDEGVHAAQTNATDALEKAESASGEVKNYEEQIQEAITTANNASATASNAEETAQSAQNTANTAVSNSTVNATNLQNLLNKLLITSPATVETFTPPSDYSQVLNGSLGSTLTLTSTSGTARFSKSDVTLTSIKTQHPMGEKKLMGRITIIKETATTSSTLSGKIFPDTTNLNLDCHALVVFTGTNVITKQPLSIVNGVLNMTINWNSAATSASIYLFDSILTQSFREEAQ